MVIRGTVCVWQVLILIPFFTSDFFLPAKKQSRPVPPMKPWISRAIKTRSISLISLVCGCRICHSELLLAAVWILKFDFNYRQGRDQSRLLVWPLSRLLSFVSVCLCFQAFVSRANMYQKQPSRKTQTMAEGAVFHACSPSHSIPLASLWGGCRLRLQGAFDALTTHDPNRTAERRGCGR